MTRVPTGTVPCILLLSILVAACDDADTAPVRPSPVAARVTPLSSYPTGLLRSGSSVSLSARVTDASGTNIVGGVVNWRTTAGTLSATSTTTDTAGLTSVTLNGREPATVTASVAGLPDMSLDVPAVDPFSVSLLVQTTNPLTNAPVSMTVTTPTTREVPNAPAPTSVIVECGNGDSIVPGIGGVVSCRYADAGPYVATGRATGSGFTANTTASIVVSAPPSPPAAPPRPPIEAALIVTATELHRSATSATWRFRATPVGGELTGDLDWFYDYTQAPPNASPARETSGEEFQDVTYFAKGTKEVSATGTVNGTRVTGRVTIAVAFP